MDKKTAGLYVSLAKALNALEAAGQNPCTFDAERIWGTDADLLWDIEAQRWTIIQQPATILWDPENEKWEVTGRETPET